VDYFRSEHLQMQCNDVDGTLESRRANMKNKMVCPKIVHESANAQQTVGAVALSAALEVSTLIWQRNRCGAGAGRLLSTMLWSFRFAPEEVRTVDLVLLKVAE
jgi:hypothetical protein